MENDTTPPFTSAFSSSFSSVFCFVFIARLVDGTEFEVLEHPSFLSLDRPPSSPRRRQLRLARPGPRSHGQESKIDSYLLFSLSLFEMHGNEVKQSATARPQKRGTVA
ncbi:hypothetical protein JDV02_001533 [Purpureocillium takamizusanense]|uniref:Uncharacterized protein n=1 Tax=Purpureocillium takamizusanense TaxID=2060973 RepID=A0A9Q8V7M7_9HYPO|nr:uncharacterized protein JDV02_001533 [Purpureocillium takamizusanense]UNI14957.1 hypothetical protein JDV02_001533 [Purpureocillium takamizusanense]